MTRCRWGEVGSFPYAVSLHCLTDIEQAMTQSDSDLYLAVSPYFTELSKHEAILDVLIQGLVTDGLDINTDLDNIRQ